MGGYWGAELKYAGYDGLIVQGRLPFVEDDRVLGEEDHQPIGRGKRSPSTAGEWTAAAEERTTTTEERTAAAKERATTAKEWTTAAEERTAPRIAPHRVGHDSLLHRVGNP